MLGSLLPIAAMLLLHGSQVRFTTQSRSTAKALHGALGGTWTGTLRYRDYQDSTRFVSLPTTLQGTTAADSTGVRLDFTYDDGPGKTVRSSDAFSLDAAARALVWGSSDGKRPPSTFSVTQFTGGKPFTLVVERDGEDDDRKARIRETLSVNGAELRILKEVRFDAKAPWVFRHEYRLRHSS
ncbi:MAG: hypothetical protein V4617_01660 [Gemmatimonadota bacterium]